MDRYEGPKGIGKRWEAVFRPRRTDDLRPQVREWIGRSFTVECVGIIDWSEEYDGQRSWSSVNGPRGITWIPECDLEFTIPVAIPQEP